jgi:methyltransferase
MESRTAYLLLVAGVALVLLGELAWAKRNVARLLAQGAREASPGHYRWMVLLHTAFLISAPLEVWLLRRPLIPSLALGAGIVLALAMALRFWVLATLGERWTTRILYLPGVEPVTGGPYRFLRHPNYLAVVAEIAALPLIHTAWCTALAFSFLNALLLRVRIRAEEAALREASSYEALFADKPRLLPGGR